MATDRSVARRPLEAGDLRWKSFASWCIWTKFLAPTVLIVTLVVASTCRTV